jgi:ankyrin repeat protein
MVLRMGGHAKVAKSFDHLWIFGVVSLMNEVHLQSPHLDETNESLVLFWAARMWHLDVLENLLTYTIHLIRRTLNVCWPISWACANGHRKIVEGLLSEDCASQ